MGKNGKFFISIIETSELLKSVWDPYAYRHIDESEVLGKYAQIHKITTRNYPKRSSPFQPVEYKHIPGKQYLSFKLENVEQTFCNSFPSVGEGQILFGTMRAYLGNIVVTPKANWLNLASPLHFGIKSEFVVITPQDGLTFFWLAYMRSKAFLESLPVGTGGTRPRLQAKALEQVPVSIPEFHIRERIHQELESLAEKEWRNCVQISSILSVVD